MEMEEELFCQRLTALRQEKGVSAREMSLALGQSPGYINNIENHNNLPSMTVFFYICEYLEISPKDYFDYKVALPHNMNVLVENLSRLKKDDFSHIAALVESLAQKT